MPLILQAIVLQLLFSHAVFAAEEKSKAESVKRAADAV